VYLALAGRGRVVVADAPQTDTSFAEVRRIVGLDSIARFYSAQGLDFEIIDLRAEEWTNRDEIISDRRRLTGDPRGYCRFDLAGASEFASHSGAGRYYGADYDDREVNRHHTGGRHEYLVSRSAVEADVMFSLPKLKTHKKVGITVSLKNLVGINGDKNWLPHHTESGFRRRGDERPYTGLKSRIERAATRQLRHLSLALPSVGVEIHRRARRVGKSVFGDTEEVVRSGNWWGNDTAWRMCLDLNKILAYGNADGTLRPADASNRKRHFALVDGIIAGQGRGPSNPDPLQAGVVVFGTSPASVDAACAMLMGFDPDRIPLVRQAFRCERYPIADCCWPEVKLLSNRVEWHGLRLIDLPPEATFHFEPHFGWAGHIERCSAICNAVS
jgi:uncharacterized protein (DUF362 family)